MIKAKVNLVSARAQGARKAMLGALPVTKLRAIWREHGHSTFRRQPDDIGRGALPSKVELVRIMTFNWDACREAVFEELERLAKSD